MSCEPTPYDNDESSSDSLATDEENENTLASSSNASDVWELFQKVRDPQSDALIEFKCLICAKSYGTGNATSTLRRHLTSKHSTRYLKPEPKQTTLRFNPYSKTEAKPITKLLVDFVATGLHPFSLVENPQFQLFIKKLNSRYIAPCRQILKENFILEFDERRKNLMDEILQIKSKVSLTTDIWTSDITKECYLGITIHFINDNWEMKSFLLDLIQLHGSHSAELITDKILAILDEFKINHKIIALTTDNGSNMIACGNQLALELERKFNNFTFSHYRCAAHIINLAVKAGMILVGDEIKKLRQFVIKLKNSPLLLDKLSEICEIKKTKFLKPLLDIDTRWNSTYLMIARQIIMQSVSEILVQTNFNELKNLFPTLSEWRHIKVFNIYNY
jgi:hypothetical protein